MRILKWLAIVVLALGGLIIALRLLFALPPNSNRPHSRVIPETAQTRLGRGIAPLVAAHPALSGVHPLQDAHDAFAARYLLAQRAEKTLDVQYYIWRADLSGTLLFKALYDAAERGVRVRLLLDDNNTSGLDPLLVALDAHPNIEVRLFNPFGFRRFRVLGYLTDFSRANRRMHNKSFTADNQATIIGGRNVGDEYFGATDDVLFADLDVLAVGPVVREVSDDFDRYWLSESSYPAGLLLGGVPADLSRESTRAESDAAANAYLDVIRTTSFVSRLVAGTLPLEWARTTMISDDPVKALGRAERAALLTSKMKQAFGEARSRVDLVSPYFVPGSQGVEMMRSWVQRGARVQVLTNSLEATDVAAVHSGYAKRRKALLAAGVILYELKRLNAPPRARGTRFFGSSASSLHAKTFAVDGTNIFIGSFNFDPRSAKLNTEIGFVIESPRLAKAIENAFNSGVPARSYALRLSPQGDVEWIERRGERTVIHVREPGTTALERTATWLLGQLPIEWLL